MGFRRIVCLGASAGLLLSMVALRSDAATPDSVTFAKGHQKTVSFEAGPFDVSNPVGVGCITDADPSCENIEIVLGQPTVIEIETRNPDAARAAAEDHDLRLFDEGGEQVASSLEPGSAERIAVTVPAGAYRLEIQAFLAAPGSVLEGEMRLTRSKRSSAEAPFFDDPIACLEGVPEAATPTIPVVAPEVVDLSVAVLLDGDLNRRHVPDFFDLVAESYAPLGIDLTVASVGTIDLAERGAHEDSSGAVVQTTSAEDAIAQARDEVGGSRDGVGADIVYVVTDKDIFTGGAPGNDVEDSGRTYAVVGLADCIGGVRYGSRSFAVSEVTPGLSQFEVGPVSFYHRAKTDTVAHEIGHLLGAHHHYANCVEGVPTETPAEDGTVEASPCTLMTNFVDLTSLNFSTLSSAVVRGHAELRAAQRD